MFFVSGCCSRCSSFHEAIARDPKGTMGALKATFWVQKATTWHPLGPTLGPLGVHLAHLGPTLADFGPTWGTLGAPIYRKTPEQPPQRTLCYIIYMAMGRNPPHAETCCGSTWPRKSIGICLSNSGVTCLRFCYLA